MKVIPIENKIVKFQVNGQHLKRVDKVVVVNKLRNILVAKFEFKQGWSELTPFAIFKNKKKSYCIPISMEENIGECVVPHEVLQSKWFKMTLFGGNLITTNELTIYLVESGYTTDISSTAEPSADIFVQVYEELSHKADIDHTHVVEDINGLSEALDSVISDDILSTKADLYHTHTSNDIVDLEQTLEEEIDEDLDLLLLNLSEKINQI